MLSDEQLYVCAMIYGVAMHRKLFCSDTRYAEGVK